MLKPPAGFVLVSGNNGFDTIHQQKFGGPGLRISKLMQADDGHYYLQAFKGNPISLARFAALQSWVDELNA